MKKKYFFTAFAAALLFAGFAFTACDDDDDNSAPGTKPTIKFENVIPTKNYVQSGTFAAVAPGAGASVSASLSGSGVTGAVPVHSLMLVLQTGQSVLT